MKRIDAIKCMETRELADCLCEIMQSITDQNAYHCELCPATRLCSYGHNGFIDYLEGEFDERYSSGIADAVWDKDTI